MNPIAVYQSNLTHTHSLPLFLPSDLSKNQISDIAADAFSGLRSLTSL